MSVVSYKCPNCGGELVFDPKTQKYKCGFCFSYFNQEEMEAANPAASLNKEEKAAEAACYSCPSCGAEIVTDGTTAATFCYYCHNPVVLKGQVSGEYLPDLVLPFQIDRKKAEEKFLEYVHKKKFVPRAFFSEDQIEKFSGVYFPTWVFGAKMHGNYRAAGKKIRIWRHGDTEFTETQEYDIERSGNLELWDLNKNALKKANQKLVEGVWPYDLSKAQDFTLSYLSGFLAERRDVESEELNPSVKQEFTDYGEKLLRESVRHYDAVITKSSQCVVDKLEGKYVLLPVWTLTYKGRNGKIYYYAMNGQSGKVTGELPIDYKKVALLFFSVMLPVLILCLIGGYLL